MLYNNLPNCKRHAPILASKVYFGFVGEYAVITARINEKIVLFEITEQVYGS